MKNKTTLYILLFVFVSLTQILQAQLPYIVNYSGIQEEIKELWHDTDQGITYAITDSRLSIIVASDIKNKKLGAARNISLRHQTMDRFCGNPVFAGTHGEIYELSEESIKLIPTGEDRYPNSSFYKTKTDLWIAGFDIQRTSLDGNNDISIPIITNSEIPYWDIKQYDQYIWFANYGVGAYRVDVTDNTIKRFSTLNGLPSNHISCLHFTENGNLFLGYPGGIISIDKDNQIERISLNKHIGKEVIKEIESDGNGNIWFLTGKKLGYYNAESNTTHILPTSKDPNFKINTLEYSPTQNLMFLGTSNGLFISSKDGFFYNDKDIFKKGKLYYFGKELLISDNESVKTYNPKSNQFEYSDYRAINNVFNTENGDFWVTDGKYAILLDKDTKSVKQKVKKPTHKINQIRKIGSKVYFCYDYGLYVNDGKKSKAIIQESEPFYNVFECNQEVYALSEHGLYLIENDEVNFETTIETNESLLSSNSQYFVDKNTLLIPAVRSVIKVHCGADESEIEHFTSLDSIYDFKVHKEELYILTYDRIKVYDKKAYVKNPYSPKCIIPCNADEQSSLFLDNEDRIWIRNYQGLAYVKKEESFCNIIPPKLDETLAVNTTIFKESDSSLEFSSMFHMEPQEIFRILLVMMILSILYIFLTFAVRSIE